MLRIAILGTIWMCCGEALAFDDCPDPEQAKMDVHVSIHTPFANITFCSCQAIIALSPGGSVQTNRTSPDTKTFLDRAFVHQC